MKAAGPGLLLLVGLAYGMTWNAPVVSDDVLYVQDNPLFQKPVGPFLGGVFSADYFTLSREATYQPLVTVIHYFTHASPPVFRLIGILFHALNAFLVFLLAARLGMDSKAAFIAAALWALFPTHTEAVDISSFKGHLLSFAGVLSCLLFWTRAVSGDLRSLGLSYLCFALALLAKEPGIAALGLVAAYSWCYARERDLRYQLRCGLGFAAIASAYLYLRFSVLTPPVFITHGARDPLALLGWYVKMLAVPYPLCRERTLAGTVMLDAAAGLYAAAVLFFRKDRNVLFGLLWIGIACLPFLRFIPFAASNPVSDRFLYLPAAGFCLLLAEVLARNQGRYLLYGLIAVWGSLTIQRNRLCRDERALYEQTAACAPEHPRAQASLGQFHLDQGEFLEAKAAASRALALDPAYPGGWNVLGIAEFQLGDPERAKRDFERAVSLDERMAEPHNNLANVLAALGKKKEATTEYRKAMGLRPDWAAPREGASRLESSAK